MAADLSNVVVVVVAVVVSVVSLLSLLLLGPIAVDSAPSSKFLPRTCRRDEEPFRTDEFFALPLAFLGATPVVHMLASLLPVLLSLPVLQCRHRRSVHARRNDSSFK